MKQNLKSRQLITHPAGEHSSSSNPCWHHHIKTSSVFCTITVFTFLFFATAVIITLRTSAGSLRSKSFRTRSSRKLGREHNKEGGGEKGNACSEKSLSFCRGSRVTFFFPKFVFFLEKVIIDALKKEKKNLKKQMAREHLVVVGWGVGRGWGVGGVGIEKSSETSQFVFEELHL